jgi:hypothetical protein
LKLREDLGYSLLKKLFQIRVTQFNNPFLKVEVLFKHLGMPLDAKDSGVWTGLGPKAMPFTF